MLHNWLKVAGACAAMSIMAAVSHAEVNVQDIPDNKYVQVKDGHLSLDGKRVRYWGFIGHFWLVGKLKENYAKPGDSPEVIAAKSKKGREVIDAYAQRIHDLGFNLVRYWGGHYDYDYTPGDASRADFTAYSFYALEKRGIKLWMTLLGRHGDLKEEHADLVDDGNKEEWLKALAEFKPTKHYKNKSGRSIRNMKTHAWDERTALAAMASSKRFAHWPNKYKGGLRVADDPQVAIWELTNEEWYFKSMINGRFNKLPAYFRRTLQIKWNDFLIKKYNDEASITTVWGYLLPGENFKDKSVLLTPLASPSDMSMVSDANPHALETLKASGGKFTREDFSERRARDVVEFISTIHIAYKNRFRDEAKTYGKGLSLSPLLLDTGGGYNIHSVNLHQGGDASAMCAYIWQVAIDKQQPRFPFMSGLDEPPRLAMGIPWLEVGRIPGKPFFAYEFGTNNPDKYRAEVGYRVAALGAIQDWDVINWHIFGRPNDPAEEKPYSKQMNYSHKNVSIEGVHYKHDEVASAAMRGAGYLFRTGALAAAPNPTHMSFGKDLLYDPRSGDYGGSFGKEGDAIAPTTWRHGLTMSVDPNQAKTEVKGPKVYRGLMEANPVRPTDGLEFDWKQGHMQVDRPNAVSYTGFSAQKHSAISFSNGISLTDVSIINDPGMPYPMTKDENYISFSVVAEDGLALDKTKRAMIHLVSTSFNNGFELNHDEVAKGHMPYTGKPFAKMKNPKPKKGEQAVLVARVGGTLTAGPIEGMNYRFLDWHFKELGKGTVGKTLTIPADQEIFYVELTR